MELSPGDRVYPKGDRKKLKGISYAKLKVSLIFLLTFFLVRFILKGISYLNLTLSSRVKLRENFLRYFSCKMEGEFNIYVNFFWSESF